MKQLINRLGSATAGKKTYLIIGITAAYIVAGKAGVWPVDAELVALGVALAVGTLRSGVSNEVRNGHARKAPVSPVATGILAAALVLGAVGCGTVKEGNDPVVVNAERTTAAALDVFDGFLLWEHNNREALSSVPEIKRSADYLRQNGQRWLVTARNLTKAYKDNRTDDNRVSLEQMLTVLRTTMAELAAYMADYGGNSE